MRRAEPTEKNRSLRPCPSPRTLSPPLVRAPFFQSIFQHRPHGKATANVAHRVAVTSINVDEPPFRRSQDPSPLSCNRITLRAIIHQARTGLPTAAGVTSSLPRRSVPRRQKLRLRQERSPRPTHRNRLPRAMGNAARSTRSLLGRPARAEFLLWWPVLARLLKEAFQLSFIARSSV